MVETHFKKEIFLVPTEIRVENLFTLLLEKISANDHLLIPVEKVFFYYE